MSSSHQTVKTKVIKIGNSKGIRIPKTLIEQCELHSEVELEVKEGCLTVRPVTHPRAGWDKAFAEMANNGDDELLDGPVATEWDKTEWEW